MVIKSGVLKRRVKEYLPAIAPVEKPASIEFTRKFSVRSEYKTLNRTKLEKKKKLKLKRFVSARYGDGSGTKTVVLLPFFSSTVIGLF